MKLGGFIKIMEFNTKTIREIALESPQTTRVFEEYKIDYCCGGRRPFADACLAAGVDPHIVAQKLGRALAAFDENADFPERKSASDLIDYIIDKHHVFTASELARLAGLMEKVCRKHGETHAGLFELQAVFSALAEDLTAHMRKEEVVLFPFIKTLQESLARNLSVAPPHFRTVQNPVRMMLEEHDAAGDLLRRMRELTSDYTLPPEACPTFTALYAGCQDLEKDLHRHIHLENNVLFPQAQAMEAKVFGEARRGADEVCCVNAN
jgi:regulator of cell morphogenesis and NO signaling